MSDEPISNLDAEIEALIAALDRMPDLPWFADAITAVHDQLLAALPLDAPGAPDSLAASAVWTSLAAVAREVQHLKEIRDGRT